MGFLFVQMLLMAFSVLSRGSELYYLEAPDAKAGFDKQRSDTHSNDEERHTAMPEPGGWTT